MKFPTALLPSRKSRAPKPPRAEPRGVCLREGLTGSRFLHEALLDACDAFPDIFAGAPVSADPKAFRARFTDELVDFERRRLNAPTRRAIASRLSGWARAGLVWRDECGEAPLAEHLAGAPDSASLRELEVRGRAAPTGWARVPFEGRTYQGADVLEPVERLFAGADLSDAARASLHAFLGRPAPELVGQRFAILGAGAELAPTALLLEAGADVLWLDRNAPDAWLKERFGDRPFAGRLFVADGAGCLLTQPREALAAIASFAEGAGTLGGVHSAVHLGLFAYAPGSGRELRLAGAMEALVHALEARNVASVSLYISPTTPGEVAGSCREASVRRLASPPVWQRPLCRLGALGGPGFIAGGDGRAVSRGIVTLQGPTYQAAQYLSKMMSAEALVSEGLGGAQGGSRPRVSANVAGITATRSLEHPLFQAAFIGAPRFNVRIFRPETTRSLSALLMLEDLFGDGPLSDDAQHLKQIHGGVYSHPYLFEQTIRVGAVIGLSQKPSLLVRLTRGR